MPTRDRLLAALVAALWGANFIAIHLTLEHFPPLFSVALRFVVIAVPTCLFVPLPRVRWYWLVGYGFGFGTAQFGLLFLAIHTGMPAGLASLVLQTSAPFTVLLGALLLREKPRPRQLAGLALAVLGMGVIGWHRAEVAAVLPVLLTVLGALSWAFGNLCNRKALEGNTDGNAALRLTLWMSVVPPLPMFALSAIAEGPSTGWRALGTSVAGGTGWLALGGLAYIVLLGTILGSGLWTALMRRHPAGVVAPFSLLVPVVGMTLAWLLLGERPAVLEVVAGLVVVGGVLLGIPRRGGVAGRSTRIVDGGGDGDAGTQHTAGQVHPAAGTDPPRGVADRRGDRTAAGGDPLGP